MYVASQNLNPHASWFDRLVPNTIISFLMDGAVWNKEGEPQIDDRCQVALTNKDDATEGENRIPKSCLEIACYRRIPFTNDNQPTL